MTRLPGPDQPWLRANDWRPLDVPALGSWTPRLSVSIVIPAHDPVHLPLVLAALAAQSYPAELLEVVVVDDGSDPALTLPAVRPPRTRLVRLQHGWGRAASCHAGAEHSTGDVLHWLDADMVCSRQAVEAQLRWHHLIDYAVVLGDKIFAPDDALDHLDADHLRRAIAAGAPVGALGSQPVTPHAWIEEILLATSLLAEAGPRAMRVHAGASASVSRALYVASGGMPVDLVLGEDIVLGYRLREAGAVFIPDREATALHLGETHVMRDQRQVNRYNQPFLADRVPEFRGHRTRSPRSYAVPYAEVVLPVGASSYEQVRHTVDHLLASSLPDSVITLLAPWSTLHDERRPVLEDPELDLRLVRAAYLTEDRVRFREALPALSDATFRLALPGPDHFPDSRALVRLLREMESEHQDALDITLPGQGARLLRTASVARARRVGHTAADVPSAGRWSAEEAGFVARTDSAPVKRLFGPAAMVRRGASPTPPGTSGHLSADTASKS